MREYTFLLRSGFRTEHFQAHTLKQAIRKAKAKYGDQLSGAFTFGGRHVWHGQYQTCSSTAMVMSGWLTCDYDTERAIR